MKYPESKGNTSLLKEALELNKQITVHSTSTNSLCFSKCKKLTNLTPTEHKSTASAKTIKEQTL